MKGAERRERRAYELAIFGAWQSTNFARTEKLKPLAHYLAEMKPKVKQTPDSILAALEAHQAAGAPINIKKLN